MQLLLRASTTRPRAITFWERLYLGVSPRLGFTRRTLPVHLHTARMTCSVARNVSATAMTEQPYDMNSLRFIGMHGHFHRQAWR